MLCKCGTNGGDGCCCGVELRSRRLSGDGRHPKEVRLPIVASVTERVSCFSVVALASDAAAPLGDDEILEKVLPTEERDPRRRWPDAEELVSRTTVR